MEFELLQHLVEFWDKWTFNGEKQCDREFILCLNTWRTKKKKCKHHMFSSYHENGTVNEPNRNERRNIYSSNGMRFPIGLCDFECNFQSQFFLLESHIESNIWFTHMYGLKRYFHGNFVFQPRKKNQELKRVRCLIVKICLTCFS